MTTPDGHLSDVNVRSGGQTSTTDSNLLAYAATHPGFVEMELQDWLPGRLRLVVEDLQYAQPSLEWLTNPLATRLVGGDFSHVSLIGEEARIREILMDQDAYHWIIEVDNRAVGNIHIKEIAELSAEFGRRSASLTYMIGDPNLWGRGIATASTAAVLDWAFGVGEFQMVIARILPQNSRSLAVIRKLGFSLLREEPYDGPDIGEPSQWQCFALQRSGRPVVPLHY